MKKLFLVMSILVVIAGCQPGVYYDRPGATPAMFEKDSAECKSLARQTGTVRAGGYFSRGGGEIELGSSRGATDGSFMDTGDDQYYRQYQDCLRQKGWRKVTKPAQQ